MRGGRSSTTCSVKGFVKVPRMRLTIVACVLSLALVACDDGGACSQEEVVTASELRYVDVECGEGAVAKRGDSVTVHYTGTLENGEEFDSSVGGEPFQFKIGGGDVIAGWEEGVPGMRVGGVRELTIPPELGYGASGYPPVIPPDATLKFEIELIEVVGG